MKFAVLGGIAALGVLAGSANAQVVTLEDQNTTVRVNVNSASGMSDWIVDGVDHLFQQWFWYRIGNTAEAPLNTLGLQVFIASNTNFDPRDDTLVATYSNGTLQAEVTFGVLGGNPGDGFSDILEQIRLVNVGNTAIDVSFFQYSDFDLNGSAGGDTAYIPNGNVADQYEGGVVMQETVVTPAASAWQVGSWPSIINLLNDGVASNLNNDGGPYSGDMSWAYQWNFRLAPGDSFLISKDKLITPAPGALALLGLGGLAVARRRR
jgi:hypothetical protein